MLRNGSFLVPCKISFYTNFLYIFVAGYLEYSVSCFPYNPHSVGHHQINF